MADQVECRVRAGAGQAGEGCVLGLEFLHVILAEVAQAEGVSFQCRAGGKFLGDRNQGYLGTAPARALYRAVDTFFDLIQAFAKHSASRSITAAAAAPNS